MAVNTQEESVGSVRVAIVGVGNCASALVQGVEYYRGASEDGFVPGLMRPRLGGYHVGDIEFSAAFDIDARKVGLDLAEAIGAPPNNTVRFAQVPPLGVPVQRGMTHDGLGHYLSQVIAKAPGPTADITNILRETRTDIVVNFLPVGSEMATKWYVELMNNQQLLEAAGVTLRVAFLAVFFYYSAQHVIRVQSLGQLMPALRAPMWLAYLAMPAGSRAITVNQST